MSSSAPRSLSSAAASIWAKTDQRGSLPEEWAPLHVHLEDAGRVAGVLYEEWLPRATKSRLTEAIGSATHAHDLAVLCAAIHDIGKATPAFAVQVKVLPDRIREAGLPLATDLPERKRLPHALAGQIIVDRWLASQGVNVRVARAVASVVGFHHGVTPSRHHVNTGKHDVRLLGGPEWQLVQDELLETVVSRLGLEGVLAQLGELSPTQDVLMTLAGLVVTADWVASSQDTFPLFGLDDRVPQDGGLARFSAARRRFSLPPPWVPFDDLCTAHEMLASRFALPAGSRAYPAQELAVEAARTMRDPGLIVLEAPCGDGKSEAALLAAEVLAARFGLSGVMVGLPTQATSNAMFARVIAWLANTSPGEKSSVATSVYLAHGKARWQSTFRDVRAGNADALDVGRDERRGVEPYVDSWMTGRRKGALSDIVVGTIDQVLVAALCGRYVQLRHLALARKVVILDEVHAYDVYMSEYLKAALRWLGAYGVPVIALSATLTNAMRLDLAEAYEHGRLLRAAGRDSAVRARDGANLTAAHEGAGDATLTISQAGTLRSVSVPSAGRRYTVDLEYLDDSVEALVDRVLAALGTPVHGCVLVLCNTVSRAQDRYRALHSVLGDVVTLSHSRFVMADRRRNDERLVAELGKPAHADRPIARVVVSTQVAEQSLDIDADLLITDIAPIDLIIQRIGRLHRHDRDPQTRGRALREPRCVVTGYTTAADGPPRFDRGSEFVYGRWALLQAAGLIGERLDGSRPVAIPEDASALVEEAYGPEATGPAAWHEAVAEASAARSRDDSQSATRARVFQLPPPGGATGRASDLTGLLDARVSDDFADADSARAQVRDSVDSFEVVLLTRDRDGQYAIPAWIDDPEAGTAIPSHSAPAHQVAAAMAACAVRLPAHVGRGAQGEALIRALESSYVHAWQASPEVSGQLVLAVDPDTLTASIADFHVHYDPTEGLRMVHQ